MPELQLQDQINMMLIKVVYRKEETIGTNFWIEQKKNIDLMSNKILEFKNNKWFCHIKRNQ
jgi:hypothetical protein